MRERTADTSSLEAPAPFVHFNKRGFLPHKTEASSWQVGTDWRRESEAERLFVSAWQQGHVPAGESPEDALIRSRWMDDRLGHIWVGEWWRMDKLLGRWMNRWVDGWLDDNDGLQGTTNTWKGGRMNGWLRMMNYGLMEWMHCLIYRGWMDEWMTKNIWIAGWMDARTDVMYWFDGRADG